MICKCIYARCFGKLAFEQRASPYSLLTMDNRLQTPANSLATMDDEREQTVVSRGDAQRSTAPCLLIGLEGGLHLGQLPHDQPLYRQHKRGLRLRRIERGQWHKAG